MKRYIFAIVMILLAFQTALFAQKSQPDPKIKAVKVALITERVKMSEQEAIKFWPLYNKYEEEKRVVWRQKKQLRENNKHNANSKELLDALQKCDEQLVTIKGKYKNEFLKIIKPDQLAAMYMAESEFKDMLLKQLKN